jgi:hypothetical protein
MSKKAAAGETGKATVTVALKHPTGIVLEAFVKEKGQEPVLGGGFREVTVWRSSGKQYPLNGNRVPFGVMPSYPIVAGYALTHGIPKEVWEAWAEQHKDSPLLEQELIAAYDTADKAEDFAQDKDNAARRSGMEALSRKGDPRVDKKRQRDGTLVDGISVADEQPASPAPA